MADEPVPKYKLCDEYGQETIYINPDSLKDLDFFDVKLMSVSYGGLANTHLVLIDKDRKPIGRLGGVQRIKLDYSVDDITADVELVILPIDIDITIGPEGRHLTVLPQPHWPTYDIGRCDPIGPKPTLEDLPDRSEAALVKKAAVDMLKEQTKKDFPNCDCPHQDNHIPKV